MFRFLKPASTMTITRGGRYIGRGRSNVKTLAYCPIAKGQDGKRSVLADWLETDVG